MSIGIIGVGMVGSAIKRSFNMYNPSCYDPYKGFKDDISKCDLVFVCVPTPTTPKRDQDVSFLFKVLINLKELNFAGVVAIKCTLLPNTIDDLSRAFPMLKLCHNPEFLREKTAYEDFITQKVTLIGIPSWYDQAQVDLIKAGLIRFMIY
jgi:UDP-glucose 6-dehydrogenase